MPDNAASLPDDIESLRRLVAAQRSELDAERAARMAAEGAILSRDLLIEKLKVQITRLKRMHFGRSSEKLASEIAQLELALEELETAEAELPLLPASPIRERKTPDRSLPAHLPREEIIHLPASGDCVCPACGGALRRFAEDADEMLDIEPVVFKVIRHVRPKFSCRACEKIVQAPAPDKAIARGKASFRMIGHIIVSKFDHHLPLYRQAEMMAAQGVDIDRSTLAGWTGQGAALLDPIVARIREMVLSASKLHTDDTPVPMLDPGNGKTKTARLWVHAIDDRAHGGLAKPAVWFAFTPDRRGLGLVYTMGAETLAERLEGHVEYPRLVARDLWRAHHERYKVFWAWSDKNQDHAMAFGWLQTVFGWHVRIGANPNPRSLRNFPVQGNCAEMLRIACCLMTEQGIEACAPVHDAVLIQAPIERLDDDIQRARECMAEASRATLGGFELRTDANPVRYPDRYQDKRGKVMFERVSGFLTEVGDVKKTA